MFYAICFMKHYFFICFHNLKFLYIFGLTFYLFILYFLIRIFCFSLLFFIFFLILFFFHFFLSGYPCCFYYISMVSDSLRIFLIPFRPLSPAIFVLVILFQRVCFAAADFVPSIANRCLFRRTLRVLCR